MGADNFFRFLFSYFSYIKGIIKELLLEIIGFFYQVFGKSYFLPGEDAPLERRIHELSAALRTYLYGRAFIIAFPKNDMTAGTSILIACI
jgi:hypothetical protein